MTPADDVTALADFIRGYGGYPNAGATRLYAAMLAGLASALRWKVTGDRTPEAAFFRAFRAHLTEGM